MTSCTTNAECAEIVDMEAGGCCLGMTITSIPEGEVFYARFRELVKELGYERTDVGFSLPDKWAGGTE